MLNAIAVIAAILVAGVLVIAATRPETFRVQRSTVIEAPPDRVFELLSDFQRWPAWSPWEKKDPGMKRLFGSITRGVGASYAWEGNKDVGQGRMEIAEAIPPSRLSISLDFVKPFKAHNTVEFTLQPQGDATAVTWAMQGRNGFLGKVMGLLVDMDRMVGKDFEAGLGNLKAVAEG